MSCVMRLLKPVDGNIKITGYDERFKIIWTDGKTHEMIRHPYQSSKYINRIMSNMDDLKWVITTYDGCTNKCIPCDEVEYAQGWYFKNAFLNKKYPVFYTTSKESMKKFFDRYLKFKKDNIARETATRFLNRWEDGLIFECSY